MEVPESPDIGSPNPPSTLDRVKTKKKNLHKMQHPEELANGSLTTNACPSSPPPEDDLSRPTKRKRDSESGHQKKLKKKKREALEDADEEIESQDTSRVSHSIENQEYPLAESSKVQELSVQNTQNSVQNGDEEPWKTEGTPDHTSDATRSDRRPKKTRSFRIGGKNQLKVGFFVQEEVKALEEFKIRFCNAHGIQGRTFDAMIQHSERSGDEWPIPTHIQSKVDLWNDIYALIPDRDRRSVYRFMRRHFQDTTQKAHEWTPEQDEELIRLHAQHGPKYAYIAKLLGRSDDDVTQRWKNRLQHRDTKKTGAWSESELREFVRSLEEYRKVLIENTADPQKAGKDIWEMDLKSISWGSISNAMNNTRTRQQCADKWRKISKTIQTLRETVDPGAQFDPAEAVKRNSRHYGGAAREKSARYVRDEVDGDAQDDDDDDEEEEEETRIPSTTPAFIPKLEFAAEQEKVDLADVAKEPSVESSPSHDTPSPGKTNKPKNPHLEEFAGVEASMPSSPVSEEFDSQETKLREERKERKRRKKEKKEKRERKRRESEAAAAADTNEAAANDSRGHRGSLDGEEAEKNAPITPKEKKSKDKKRRNSEVNGSESHEAEQTESSRKKSKKEKKKRRSLKGARDIWDISDSEA